MAKKKAMNDDIFGHLTHSAGDGWKRPIDLTIFDQLCTGYLIVQIDPNTGIEQNQIVAYKAFRDNRRHVDYIPFELPPHPK